MESQVRQSFPAECEAAVNCMVNKELYVSCVHQSMSCYFDGAVVVLRYVTQFLKEKSYEAKEHTERVLSPHNKRGGRVVLQDMQKPERDEWGNSLEALQCDLQLEKTVNQALLDLQKLAMEKSDSCLCDFPDSEYLEKQVKAIKQLGDHLTNLKHLGVPQNAMGEYLFDKLTLGESS
ncbi:ferritin heavy chain A-like [Caretta caretta]|uniref:ferritin heavy chain A-like n=1 Tax=Caretta caretta TaxID=8467 RepID=UPI0020940900|nr:ferritin heavy chain A-like [Caretta caretta]